MKYSLEANQQTIKLPKLFNNAILLRAYTKDSYYTVHCSLSISMYLAGLPFNSRDKKNIRSKTKIEEL